MALTFRSAATFGGGRRWGIRFHLAAGAVLALYCLLVSNIIAYRHPVRLDLTEEGLQTLSRGTREKLAHVKEPIRVVIPTVLQRDNKEQEAHLEVLGRARFLLNEYMAVQPLIQVVAEVNVFHEPERWMKVRDEFDLSASQVNRIIFVAGKANEFRQTVTPLDLARFGAARDPLLSSPEILGYRGEKALTDAITRLILREKKKVYFTQGHQEMGMVLEPGAPQGPEVLNAVRRELETEGYEPAPLSLSTVADVPADCKVLVIAGAFQRFAPAEIEAVQRYLRGGGRLCVALRSRRTGLEDDLLAGWGVKALDGKINYRVSFGGVISASPHVPVREYNVLHPVTRIFQEMPRFDLRLYEPRPLTGDGKERFLEAEPLMGTGKPEQGEAYFLVKGPDQPIEQGRFTLALAVEQKVPLRPPPAFQRLDARLVVIGAASFLQDSQFQQGSHRDFFLSALAWLAGEESSPGGGQVWKDRTLKMDASIQRFLFWVPIFLLPGVFLLAGGIVYYVRRA